MSEVNYIIKDKCVYIESDSKDNPIIAHLDNDGNSIAKFEPPFTIVEGISAKLSGKTAILSISGKRGKFFVFKIPADVVKVLSNALEDLNTDDNPINQDTLNNIKVAIEDLKNE